MASTRSAANQAVPPRRNIPIASWKLRLAAYCGRTIPCWMPAAAGRVSYCDYLGLASGRSFGVDVGDFGALVTGPNCRYIRAYLSRIDLPDASVDIVVSRSVRNT